MGAVLTRAVAGAHRVSLLPSGRWFARAAADPARTQRKRFDAILTTLRGADYGRTRGLRDVRSVRDFQARVPVADADALRPWIDRIARGEPDVLTTRRVVALERSGGSSASGTKLVPYTRAFLDEISAATGPWLDDLHRHFPGIRHGRSYWAVSPVAQAVRVTDGGVPLGFEDDTEYFGPLARWGLRRLMAVPPEVARITDVARWRHETARHLVAAEDLALVSVWSPSYLTLLLEHIETHLDALLDDVPRRRAAHVRARLAAGCPLAAALWPRLALVSCWMDGSSAAFAHELRERFLGATPVQGKGLLATEGVVTIPLRRAEAPVLAVESHFFEFLDVDHPDARPLLAHELHAGGRYSPLLTTGGGLVRYHLQDVVACVGHHGALPMLRFEGRLDRVSDLCGEKVGEGQAAAALACAWRKLGRAPRFAMLAPSFNGRPHYRLYVEDATLSAAAAETLADVVDAALAQAHPYRYCRELGQLGPVRAVRVRDAWRAWQEHLAARGLRVGALKPGALDVHPAWDEAFEEVRA